MPALMTQSECLAEQYVGLPAEVAFESAGLPAPAEAVPST